MCRAVPQSRPKSPGRQANGRPSSRYHDVYARWQRDPEGFWGEAAQARSTGIEQPKKVFDKDAGIYGRWFTGGVVNTCYNALDRHVADGRNDQAALIYNSPVTNTKQTFTYGRMLSEVQIARRHAARLRRQERRRRHPLYADGAGSGVRHAGLRAHRRHPLGGVRRLRAQGARHPHRRRASRSSSCRRAAASKAPASCRTSRCSTKRSSSPSTSRTPASSCSARNARPR